MVPTAMDGVLRKLATRLGPVHGEPMPLDGGMTGRVFRVGLGAGDYVVHLPGKDTGALGIDRGAEQDATRAAARVGVGPEVAAYLPDSDVLVTRYVDGRPLRMDEVSEPDVLADVAETLRALHKGPRLRTKLSPFRAVERYREIATDRGVEADARYDRAHALSGDIEAAMQGRDHAPVPCHGDLAPPNLIYDGERVRIVDWEYAGMGDRFFDLGNLSANAVFDEGDDEWLLTAYFNEPPTDRRFATLRLMRLMSDFRDAMWGLVQSAISPADYDFAGYAETHFARFEEAAGDPQVYRWLEQARVIAT